MYGVAYFMLKVFNKCNGVKIIFITLFSHYSFNTIKTQMTNKKPPATLSQRATISKI